MPQRPEVNALLGRRTGLSQAVVKLYDDVLADVTYHDAGKGIAEFSTDNDGGDDSPVWTWRSNESSR